MHGLLKEKKEKEKEEEEKMQENDSNEFNETKPASLLEVYFVNVVECS
jgi:hypothetical protein